MLAWAKPPVMRAVPSGRKGETSKALALRRRKRRARRWRVGPQVLDAVIREARLTRRRHPTVHPLPKLTTLKLNKVARSAPLLFLPIRFCVALNPTRATPI
jgi:hypothetical protein